jgi:3'-phosphoadenosine 5'-phosphosulfate (PAPS) 3'-phosphatase
MIDHQLAVATIRRTLLALRPRLLAAYGQASFSVKADGSSVTELDVAVEEALKVELASVVPDKNRALAHRKLLRLEPKQVGAVA